jgi:hypothetical protein
MNECAIVSCLSELPSSRISEFGGASAWYCSESKRRSASSWASFESLRLINIRILRRGTEPPATQFELQYTHPLEDCMVTCSMHPIPRVPTLTLGSTATIDATA